MRANRVKGFTLIELMVTVVIIVILAAMAAPNLRDFFERYRLKGAVEDVVTELAAARQGAVATDRNVKVKFSDDATDWCVGAVQAAQPTLGELALTDPAACDCAAADALATCVVGGAPLVAGVQGRGITISAGSGRVLTYDSKNGALSTLTATQVDFLSHAGNYELRVEVSPLGQARICDLQSNFPGFSAC